MVRGGGEETRRAIVGVIGATAIALVMVQAPMLTLAESVTVEGTLSYDSGELVSDRMAGGNEFVELRNVWNVAGDLEGKLKSNPKVVIFSTGKVLVTEWAVFSVTWGDYEGTIKVRDVGWMVGPGLFHLDATIVGGGTGDLAEVRGYGSIDIDDNAGTATYSFDLYWE